MARPFQSTCHLFLLAMALVRNLHLQTIPSFQKNCGFDRKSGRNCILWFRFISSEYQHLGPVRPVYTWRTLTGVKLKTTELSTLGQQFLAA